MTVRSLLEQFPSFAWIAKRAQTAGLKLQAQTVQKWAMRGRVPLVWHDHIVGWASELELEIEATALREAGGQVVEKLSA